MKCTSSIAAITLSSIDLSGTNADWLSEIHLLSTFFSLLARTLATILYSTLHRAIGLQSFIEVCDKIYMHCFRCSFYFCSHKEVVFFFS
ncbi:hypothetical protein QL285_088910 [Trifolium repens]|nr:hypothetical protein QL285_088910 [Trifolium repens]